MARCHLGVTPERYPWLTFGTPVRVVADVMLGADYWERHFASADAPVVPDAFLGGQIPLQTNRWASRSEVQVGPEPALVIALKIPPGFTG